MKKLLPVLAATLGLAVTLPAQVPAIEPAVAAATRFEASQLDELLGPIALYPDALIALILPASTASSDVVLAARFVRDGGDVNQVEAQPWDDSVRALAHYPDVLKWMDDNLAWTKQLGEAFVAQPAEVMNAVQRLRARARAVGSLVDTPQQQVVIDNTSAISIVPSQPDTIYVPYYDPEVVYLPRPVTYYSAPLFSFSRPYSTGFWLSYNLDWHRRSVWCVNRHDRQRHWQENRAYWHRPSPWGQPAYASNPHYYRPWAPRPGYVQPHRSTTVNVRLHTAVARPNHAGSSFARVDGRTGWNGSSHGRDRRDSGHTRSVQPHHRTHSNPNPAPAAPPLIAASTIPNLRIANPITQLATVTPSPTYQRPDRDRRDHGRREPERTHTLNHGRAYQPPHHGTVIRSQPQPAPVAVAPPAARAATHPAHRHVTSRHDNPAPNAANAARSDDQNRSNPQGRPEHRGNDRRNDDRNDSNSGRHNGHGRGRYER